MVQEMYDTAEEIMHAAEGRTDPVQSGEVDKAGSAIHEHGTCRMQMHKVKNLFVTDGSLSRQHQKKIPLCPCARASTDYLAEEWRWKWSCEWYLGPPWQNRRVRVRNLFRD